MLMLWRMQSSFTKIRSYLHCPQVGDAKEPSKIKRVWSDLDKGIAQGSLLISCGGRTLATAEGTCAVKIGVRENITENTMEAVMEPCTPRIADIKSKIEHRRCRRNSSQILRNSNVQDLNLDSIPVLTFYNSIQNYDSLLTKESSQCSQISSIDSISKKMAIIPDKPLAQYTSASPGDSWIVSPATFTDDIRILQFINNVGDALADGLPQLCSLGSGGVYFINQGANRCAIFKPQDEEPRSENNPKGFAPASDSDEAGLRRGTRPGEGAWKEYAAYLLDHQSFCGIPITSVVNLQSMEEGVVKTGSLQEYVNHDFDAEECGTSLFPVNEVHKICVADIRFVNTDRNGQNILVSKKMQKNKDGVAKTFLTPIDHGYCFPDVFRDAYFEWMYWPQAKEKFDENTVTYISYLDAESDLLRLRSHGVHLRRESADVFRFATHFLKWSTTKGLTPYQMARAMCSECISGSSSENLSKIEVMFQMAKSQVANSISKGFLSESVSFSIFEKHMTCI